MPSDFDFPPAYSGRIWQFSFTATAIRIRLATPDGNNVKRRDFEVRVTENCRILQGGASVTATSTTGRYTPSTMLRRITVTSLENAYISIIRDTTNGVAEVGPITESPEIADDDEPAQV